MSPRLLQLQTLTIIEYSSNGKLIKEYDFEKHNDKPTSVTFTVFNNDGDFFYDIGSKRSSDEQTKKLY